MKYFLVPSPGFTQRATIDVQLNEIFMLSVRNIGLSNNFFQQIQHTKSPLTLKARCE